ncbi:MAG: ABC transporter substrate-binding protein [Planctomycetota bacterium]|jgi:NitT/TauT family transport system substrate-binding protein
MKKTAPPLILAILFSFAALYSCRRPAPEPATTVRIGLLNLVSSLPLFIAQHQGFFRAKKIKFEAIPFATSDQLADALLAGELDCYIGASVIPVLASELNSPGKMKVFMTSQLISQPPFDALLVRKGPYIQSLHDLAGKRIAVFPGSTATNLLKKYLTDKNINVSNIDFVQMQPARHLPSLRAGTVDAVYAYEPTIAIARAKGGVKILSPSVYGSILTLNPISVSVVSTEFLKNHPKTAAKTIAALEDAAAFMVFNDAETRIILQGYMGLSKDAAKHCSLLHMRSHDSIFPHILQKLADILVELGEIEQHIETRDILYY